jgi:hypothetical protein
MSPQNEAGDRKLRWQSFIFTRSKMFMACFTGKDIGKGERRKLDQRQGRFLCNKELSEKLCLFAYSRLFKRIKYRVIQTLFILRRLNLKTSVI